MLNHTIIQGRLVDAPQIGQTGNGTDYANFRLAWSEKYRDKENKCFIDCKAFGSLAKFIGQYMTTKGQEIAVEGKLNTEEWEKDGQKRSKLALVLSGAHFCGSRKDNSQGGQDVAVNMTPVEIAEGELPF